MSLLRRLWKRLDSWLLRRPRSGLAGLLSQSTDLDLRIVGRLIWHAALVGLTAGLAGAIFFGALEWGQRFLLEEACGYVPLRAHGETFAAGSHPGLFRPFVLAVLPALGGLACGLLTLRIPQARGGGADVAIESFHHREGHLPAKTIWAKAAASFCSLATGGSGGREGPTMLIGGGLGSVVGRILGVDARERRILLLAGVAAGISAVFRTPLGAALLATEFLYKDGFESDALVPSILSSVVAYSVSTSLYGETTLLAHAPRFPFQALHLPLYALLAVIAAGFAATFAAGLHGARRLFAKLPLPEWARPAVGGLALGGLASAVTVSVGGYLGQPGMGLGLLGGGYGVLQVAITGAPWLSTGWTALWLLLALSLAKIIATSLTLGSGGSVGDFAPALVVGGLLGGAFGHAAQTFADASIDPGSFALVGMGVFYGGIAHVPLSALVLTCEMAGNYDLLVPLMLAMGIAFVALRRRSLYEAQAASPGASPAHRDAALSAALREIAVGDVMSHPASFVSFGADTPVAEMISRTADSTWQDVFPVADADRRLIGVVTADALRRAASSGRTQRLASDLRLPPFSLRAEDSLLDAADRLVAHGLREIPVVDAERRVVGFLDETHIMRLCLRARAPAVPTEDRP